MTAVIRADPITVVGYDPDMALSPHAALNWRKATLNGLPVCLWLRQTRAFEPRSESSTNSSNFPNLIQPRKRFLLILS
jgi:hypothetical protein